MKTPICDFAKKYNDDKTVRFHMPGHKGTVLHGLEPLDITEISNADYLFDPHGIIGESEENASYLFGTAKTLYSTEGSSMSIKTMLAIAAMNSDVVGRKQIVAPRNVHKAFINACCFLDLDVRWVYPQKPSTSLCSSSVTADDIRASLSADDVKPCAVYVTSPDYLGNIADIKAIAEVCDEYNCPLLVDNAHGAYLAFLDENVREKYPLCVHPALCGAAMCCDSAHKTLPVYTGGGYLHISHKAPQSYLDTAKDIMAMFASTSPSYLLMQSLDKCNALLADNYTQMLAECIAEIEKLKNKISQIGWNVLETEPLKITISPISNGMTGDDLADCLREYNIECEYSDYDNVVLMLTPFNLPEDFHALYNALSHIPKRKNHIIKQPLYLPKALQKMSIRQAVFSRSECINVDEAEGKICSKTSVSCQPSIPVVVSGEEITPEVIKILKRYSILKVNVVY